MADEGPTTVGSIDAKLGIDMSEWDRKVAQAKADAAELGALHPTASMDANAGPALQRINDVEAATSRLGETDRGLATAEQGLTAATDGGTAARGRHRAAIDDDSHATDANTAATARGTQAMQSNISGMGILIALAPAVLAAAAPIAAAAVGLGVAFGVMAGAGVTAFMGIKQEMAQGTDIGHQYTAGLNDMGDSFQTLEHTSAVAMLDSFNQAGDVLGQYMPFLNQTMGQFSSLLGQMGVTTLRGVLEGLKEMNPLLVTGGAELSKFVTWLFSFTGTNGFTQFIDYAIANLPPVMHFIEGLVTLAGNLLAAFAPLGPALIGGLNMLVDLLNSFPLPVLAGLVTTAVLMAPAFKLAGMAVATFGTAAELAGGEVTFFGMAADLAIPVVGILVAAVAGIGIAMAASSAGTNTATSSMAEYFSELEQSNGAIDDSIRKTTAKALVDSGAAAAAQQLGINTALLVPAALGSSDAQKQLNDAITAAKSGYENSSVSVDDYGRATHVATQAQQDQYNAADKLQKAIDGQAGTFNQAKTNQQLYGDALVNTNSHVDAAAQAEQDLATAAGINGQAYQAAIVTQASTATQLGVTTAAMYVQNDAAGILKASLDHLNGKALSAADAQNSFDSSLVNMGTHMSSTGKQVQFTTANIGDMSSASVALRGQLNGQITNLQGVIEANGGLANSTGAARDQMVTMRQQIIDNAVAHGVDRDAVTAYIDKILAIPATVPPTKLDVDAAAAEAKLAAFQQQVWALQGKAVTITTDVVTNHVDTGVPNTTNTPSTPGIVQKFAHGGMVASYLASGGYGDLFAPRGTDTQPAMLTPGEIVMNTSAVASIGAGNLLAANRTGQLPTNGRGGGQPQQFVMVGTLVMDSGEVLGTFRGIARAEANSAINAQARTLGGMRR